MDKLNLVLMILFIIFIGGLLILFYIGVQDANEINERSIDKCNEVGMEVLEWDWGNWRDTYSARVKCFNQGESKVLIFKLD